MFVRCLLDHRRVQQHARHGSRPSPIAQAASLPAAHSRFPGPVPAQRPAAGHDLPGERRRLRRHRRRLPRRHAAGYLSDDQLDDYQPWFDNHQRLRELVSELETLSQAIADADPRWNRRPAAPTGRTVQNSA
jgi:hypothetical protein